MRKWSAITLVCLLLFVGMPQLTEAKQSNGIDEKNLEKYLQKVSKVRGFQVTKNDIAYSLAIYEMTLSDMENAADLEDFLGEVIRKDESNLAEIYDYLEIDAQEVKVLLKENGETLDDYVFVDDLEQSIEFYLEEKVVRDPDFDQNLKVWLGQISKVRGFTVTKERVVHSLAIYEESLDNFKTVERVSDFLGEVIEKDLGNLDWIYDLYDLDKKSLLQVLKDNELNINDYVFIDDLMMDLDEIIEWEEEDFFGGMLTLFMRDYDLTEAELQRLIKHVNTIEADLMKDETIERLYNLSDRLMAFADFDTAKEITPRQALELISIFQTFSDIFQVKVEFSLIKSGTETPLSLTDLFAMDELVNASLKVKIFNLQGELLADLIITGEMVDSVTLHDAGKDISSGLNKVEQHEVVKPKSVKMKLSGDKTAQTSPTTTVKGAKLPKTASDYGMKSIAWLLVSLFGAGLLWRLRKVSGER